MLRTPPDILITTPESLFLLLTSQARETLRGIETVILDEVHAVAGTKRGAHLALSLERLERLVDGPLPAHRPVGDAATARGDRPLRRRDGPRDRARRRGPSQGARPRGRRPRRGHARAAIDRRSRPCRRSPTASRWASASSGRAARSGPRSTRRSSSSSAQHRSTIVFVNNRRLAERLALRLNELAGEELARAHHGSLAREQRIVVEELLKAGEIPCLVATSSLELGIDMGAVDLVDPGREPEVGRARPAARGARRARARTRSRRGGSSRSSAPTCSSRPSSRARCGRARSRRRASRGTRSTSSRSRSSRSAPTRRSRSTSSTSSCGARIRSRTSRARSSRTSSTCSPAAIRPTSSPSCGRGSSGIASAGVVRGRTGARQARRHERRDDPGPRPLRRVPRRRRRARGRARRGDGLRGARGPDVPARRLDAGGSRRSRATACSSPRLRACPASRRSGRARASAGPPSSARGSAGRRASSSRSPTSERDRAARGRVRPRRAGCAQPRHVSFASRRPRPASSRPTGRSSSSASATRSATGASASSRRSAAACTRRGRWRFARGCATRSTSTCSRCGRTTGSRSTSRTPTCRRPLADLLLEPGRDRGSPARRARAVRALRRAVPGERGARAPHPAPPSRAAHAALAAAAEGAEPPPGRAPLPAVPDRPRDVPRVPPGRLRPAGARARSCAASRRARSTSSRSRPPSASPFASSLLFEYVATYMYEDDTPPEERRAQALSLDRELLRELMGIEELRELLDAGAIEEVERSLRPAPRNADELHDLLRRAGPARRRRVRPRLRGDARCASGARFGFGSASSSCSLAVEDAGLVSRRVRGRSAGRRSRRRSSSRSSDALRAAAASLREDARPVHDRRGARPDSRSSLRASRPSSLRSSATTELVRGELRPGRLASASGAIPTSSVGSAERRSPCCGARSSRRSRRRSAASFPSWHGIGRRQTLREALVPLQALALPVALWESDVLPRRVPGVSRRGARRALRVGRGRLGRRRARSRRRLLPRGRAASRAAGGRGAARRS